MIFHTEVIDGFSIREFDAFWMALYSWSNCATNIYIKEFDSNTMPQERFMPTQVVPFESFVNSIAEISNLAKGIVVEITDRLTADNRTKKLDLYLQPLIRGDRTISWSVRLVQQSFPQRNLLKLMARTKRHKALADTVIGNREKPLLAELQRWLKAKGWSTVINYDLPGSEDAEVDLLGWNWKWPSEILVVEAKALLQADNPNEVRSATEEMRHAQEQVERVTRLIEAMPTSMRNSCFPVVEWDKAVNWFGVVITPEGEPGFNFDHSKIPACSFATLRNRLTKDEWQSPSRLWIAMVERKWQAEIRAGDITYDSMELAGITFEDPFIHY